MVTISQSSEEIYCHEGRDAGSEMMFPLALPMLNGGWVYYLVGSKLVSKIVIL